MYFLKAVVVIVLVVLLAILLSGQPLSAAPIPSTPEPMGAGVEVGNAVSIFTGVAEPELMSFTYQDPDSVATVQVMVFLSNRFGLRIEPSGNYYILRLQIPRW